MLTLYRIRMLLAVLVLFSGVGSAQTSSATTELRDLVEELLRNNPEIRAARYRYDASTKRPSQLSTLPDPKLTFVNVGVGQPLSRLNVSDFALLGIGVSQEVPFPGKLALAGQEARKEAESEGEMYKAVVLETTARLKTAYFDWFSIFKGIEITKKNQDLLERFEKIARARYAVGKGIQQDVLKAQVELSALAQQLEVLEQRRGVAEAQMNSLLNRPVDAPLGRPAEIRRSGLTLQLEELTQMIEAHSPRLRANQLQVEGRSVGIERSKKDFRPDFNFGFQWQKTGSLFRDYYMATAEVKIPLYFWRKQRYGLEEAVARFEESRQNYQATRQQFLFMAREQYLLARTSERLLALYESGIIPQASLSLESALAGYEVGQVDFLTLINNLLTLLGFELQYYEELARHEQALARLEPVVAKSLTQP